MLSSLRDSFDSRFETGAIRERKLAALGAVAVCPECQWVKLLRFFPGEDNTLASRSATFCGGADYFCPQCRRLFECVDLDKQVLADVTGAWVERWSSEHYCALCTGFLSAALGHPPMVECRKCATTSPVDLDELRTSAMVDHLGIIPSSYHEYQRLLAEARSVLPPHPTA